jgi:hypothetical protein
MVLKLKVQLVRMKDKRDRRELNFFYDINSQLVLPLVHSDRDGEVRTS